MTVEDDRSQPDKRRRGLRRLRHRRPGCTRACATSSSDAGRGLPRRPAAGPRAADPLRLQAPARHARGAARPLPEARLAPRRRLPDPQPDAPRAPGADLPRRPDGRGQLLIHPVVGMTKPGDVDHYTRVRCYEQLLAPLSRADDDAEPAAARDAHGRPARGALARDHPQELRLHPLHRRPRPRRPGQRLARASRSTGPTPRRSCSRQHEDELGIAMVPFKQMVYVAGPRAVRAGGRGRGRARPSSTSPAPSCAAACARGSRSPSGSPSRRWSRSCAAPTRRGTGRASPSSSPASPAPASRRSPMR